VDNREDESLFVEACSKDALTQGTSTTSLGDRICSRPWSRALRANVTRSAANRRRYRTSFAIEEVDVELADGIVTRC